MERFEPFIPGTQSQGLDTYPMQSSRTVSRTRTCLSMAVFLTRASFFISLTFHPSTYDVCLSAIIRRRRAYRHRCDIPAAVESPVRPGHT